MHNVELILPKNENLIKEAVTVLGGNVVPLKIASHRNSKVENITNMKHKLLVEEAVAALNDEPVNSQPSGAYLIDFDTIYSDSISGQGKRRWYFFQLAERKKITLYMSPTSDTTVDNDLILYKLDTATGALTELARSQNGPATYELLSYVGESGVYLFCVAAYAGDTANEFSFMARLSEKWDAREGDDSIYQAQEQFIGTIVKHTIDNSIDQDVSFFKITNAGIYSLMLMNVPPECNYQLQLLDSNANLIGSVAKNTRSRVRLNAGGYILRLLSSDGTFDVDAEVGVMVAAVPDNATGYQVWNTEDGTHCIEIICVPITGATNKYRYNVRIDGKMLDYQHCAVETVKATANTQSKCSMNTSLDTNAIGVAVGQYSGHKNTLLLSMDNAIYAESHSMKSYNFSDVSSASHISSGTDQYGMGYYIGNWSCVEQLPNMNLILDMDTMKEIDFRNPNWFYGNASLAGYKVCGSPKSANFIFNNKIGIFEGI